MKTTFLTLMSAVLAATTLTGCKKDNSVDEDRGLRVNKTNVIVTKGDTETVRVYTSSDLNNPQAKNISIATVTRQNNYIDLGITGREAGTTSIELRNNEGDHATINVTVVQKNTQTDGDFEVNTNTLFLKKGETRDVTNLIIKRGVGDISVRVGNSNLGSVKKEGSRFLVEGLGEGIHDFVLFEKAIGGTQTKTIRVPAYVIVPFKADGPTDLSLNSTYNIALKGVYSATTIENGHFDRMKMTVNGTAITAELNAVDVKNQQGQTQAKIVTGIKVTAKSLGNGSVSLVNGDEQTLNLNFTVKPITASAYFEVNTEGVLTVKPGVTLPPHVELPLNATKIADKAFENKNITSIDLKNVEEIGEYAFQGCTNLTTVTMPNVKVIGQRAFNLTKLTEIVLPASLREIGKGAFPMQQLVKITCYATTPPTLDGNPFSLTNANNRFLFVPEASIDNYATAWRTVLTSSFTALRNNGYKPLRIQ